jgi:riboflavin biosynthesis pyrimidine reductase
MDRPEVVADKLHVLHLYAVNDAVSVGAQTVRDQPELVLTIREPGQELPELEEFYTALENLRIRRGLPRIPKNIIYSPSGQLESKESGKLDHVIFNTEGVEVLIVTTTRGAEHLRELGADRLGIRLIAPADALDNAALIAAHEILHNTYGIQRLDCMGGETVLHALHDAGILDEVFVTYSDVIVEESGLQNIRKTFDFDTEGAKLIAEGKINPSSGFIFRRWRFSQR